MALICGNYTKINQTESKKSLLNLLPFFGRTLKSLHDILTAYVEQILGQTSDVQLGTLNATIKMFAQEPEKYKELTLRLFQTVQTNIDNPDVRDMAFIYWRFFDINPSVAKCILMRTKKPKMFVEQHASYEEIIGELFEQLFSISSSMHHAQYFKQFAKSKCSAENQPPKKSA